jgi:hypothetical protein
VNPAATPATTQGPQVQVVQPDRYNVPADMVLVCRWCPHRYPATVTTAIAAGHAVAEHDGVDLAGSLIEMVPKCRRCTAPMTFTRFEGTRKVFDCADCRRTRTVSRTAWDKL